MAMAATIPVRLRSGGVSEILNHGRRGLVNRAGSIILALCIAATGVWIGKDTLGLAVAKSNFRLAISLNGNNAQTIGSQSRQMLDAGKISAAEKLAVESLRRDPTIIAAVQSIGLAAQLSGDTDKANRLLSYAQQLSRRNLQTHLWAIEYYVARTDTSKVLEEYDLALRTSLFARNLLFPVLGGAISDPVVARDLIVRLKRQPLWSEAFLSFVAGDTRVTPVAAVNFLRTLRASNMPFASAGLATLVARSLNSLEFQTAWTAYVLKRPGAERLRVRDPEFKALPDDPAPFDWTLSNDGSISAYIDEQRGTNQLEVEAGSGSAGIAAQQLQLLPSGEYRLVVDARSISEGARLVWSLTCQDGAELTKLTMSSGSAKRYTGSKFTTPTNCPLQTLTLTADAGESPQALHGIIKRVYLMMAV